MGRRRQLSLFPSPPGGPRVAKARKPRFVPLDAALRRQFIHCGRSYCAKLHGPYWYAFWKVDGRTRNAYVGSDERMRELLAREGADHYVSPAPPTLPHARRVA